MTFSEKVKKARKARYLTQSELAVKLGMTTRIIQAYEMGEKKPRSRTMLKLAKELHVSTKYLLNDDCDDPLEDINDDSYIEEAEHRYGPSAAEEMAGILSKSTALFAGGELSQEQKDLFHEALQAAYFACKEASFKSKKKEEDANV